MTRYEFIDNIIQKYGSWSGDNMESVCKNCAKELQRAGFGRSDVQEYFTKDGIYNEETDEGTWDKDFVDCIIDLLPIKSSRQIKSDEFICQNRLIKHYSYNVKLPFTNFNNSPYKLDSIEFLSDNAVRIGGSAGGPYAAENTNIDVNGNLVSVYDTKHKIDHTKYYNTDLILEFVDFLKNNIDIERYDNMPTNTGMVLLSMDDTKKIEEWAKSHSYNEVNSSFIRSARYVATDPESGEVLGSADTYEEAVNEWGEDVTITDSEAAEGQEETEGGLFQSRKSIKSGVNPDVLECEKEIQKLTDYLYDIGRSDLVHEIDDDFDNNFPEDEKSYIRKVKTWCDWRESPLIDKLEEDEWQGYLNSIKSSRKITSAVDDGWEVDSSEIPEALDMFVEYYGEETALEEIARAMGTDTLEENIDYIAQQWGFGEDVENMDTAWDKYEYAKELMGTSELFTNLTKAAGYDELAEDLTFIFRQYDFREWKNRNDEIESSRKITSSKYEFEIHDMDGYAEYPMTMTDAWDHVFDVSGIDTPYPSYDAWKEDVLEAIDDDEFVNDEYLGELYDYQNDLCNKYYGHDLIANSYDGNASFEKHRQSGKSFLAYVVSKVGSGEFSEEQAVSTIMRKNNCNSAYARKIFENAMNDGTLVKSGIMEIADEINKEFNVDGDLSSWFEDYVPKDGKSNTVGGELVRAANQIIYRYHNDGDKIGFGTGKETCNPAARYIIEVATDFDMNDEIERMLNGDDYPEDYDVWVDDFKFRFTDYLRDREELFHSVNKDDMWDYKQEDDKDTSVDECFVVDGDGNEYWFDKQGDDWICATVNFAETPEFEVGDVVSEERVAEYVDFDENDDFIDFANDGFSYSAERTGDDEWEITNVELENGLANESDYWTIEDFERDTVYDANGREISTRDLM